MYPVGQLTQFLDLKFVLDLVPGRTRLRPVKRRRKNPFPLQNTVRALLDKKPSSVFIFTFAENKKKNIMAINKRMLMFAVIALVAIGIIVAIVVATSGGDDADGGFKDVDDSPKIDKGAILTPGKAEEEEPSSDPDSATVAFTLLAIGDWGGTTFKDGSCCDHYRIHEDRTTQSFFKDYHAQVNIAKLLAQSAGEMKPEAILGHGDNLYWNGVGSEDAVSRMKITWEGIYDDARLQGIPWFNVAGNHDNNALHSRIRFPV